MTPQPATHTPTPWITDGETIFPKQPSFGFPIARMDQSNAYAKANATFIVRAVNAHQELVDIHKKAKAMNEKFKELFNKELSSGFPTWFQKQALEASFELGTALAKAQEVKP